MKLNLHVDKTIDLSRAKIGDVVCTLSDDFLIIQSVVGNLEFQCSLLRLKDYKVFDSYVKITDISTYHNIEEWIPSEELELNRISGI